MGIALVAITLFVFLGNVRAAIMTALVIPISLAITLAVMTFTGDSANLLSIGAIDFGIIADIALVLTENYIRVARKYGPLSGNSGKSYTGKVSCQGNQRGRGINNPACVYNRRRIYPHFYHEGCGKTNIFTDGKDIHLRPHLYIVAYLHLPYRVLSTLFSKATKGKGSDSSR